MRLQARVQSTLFCLPISVCLRRAQHRKRLSSQLRPPALRPQGLNPAGVVGLWLRMSSPAATGGSRGKDGQETPREPLASYLLLGLCWESICQWTWQCSKTPCDRVLFCSIFSLTLSRVNTSLRLRQAQFLKKVDFLNVKGKVA